MESRLAVAFLAVSVLLALGAPRPALAPVHAAVTVEGRMLAADGTPLSNAFVSPTGMGERLRRTTDDDGRFHFELEKPGGYFCWFAAPKHQTTVIPFLVGDDSVVALDVRLAAAEYVEPLTEVFVIGDFNGFDREEGRIPMSKRADGTFVATVTTDADTLAYQLMGVHVNDYPLSGTGTDRYAFDYERPLHGDASGKYMSVVPVSGGAVDVVFDPSLLPRSRAELEVTCSDASTSGILAIHRDAESSSRRFMSAYRAHSAEGKEPSEFEYDWAGDRERAAKHIEATNEPVVHAFALLNYFKFSPTADDSLLARRVIAEVSPDSPAWSLVWAGPLNLWSAVARIANQDDRTSHYGRQVAERHADPDVRVAFLHHALASAKAAGNTVEQRRLFLVMTGEYPDHWLTEMATRSLAPDLKVVPGNPVPEFSFVSMAGDGGRISNESLRGRVYLLDFWAVWCGPCVAEMEHLHDAYKRFKDRGFTIVSISLDRKPEHVDTFRREKWPMPWLHTYIPYDDAEDLRVNFEIVGIPRPILIGADGRILAEGPTLRGDGLIEAIEAALGHD